MAGEVRTYPLTSEAECGKLPKDAVKAWENWQRRIEGKVDEAIYTRKAVSVAPTFYMARNNLERFILASIAISCCAERFEK